MPSEPEIILYTRDECHLCDLAVEIMGQCISDWKEVDIEGSLSLIREYGQRIPVLKRLDTGQKLFWPFDLENLRHWLSQEQEPGEGRSHD